MKFGRGERIRTSDLTVPNEIAEVLRRREFSRRTRVYSCDNLDRRSGAPLKLRFPVLAQRRPNTNLKTVELNLCCCSTTMKKTTVIAFCMLFLCVLTARSYNK